MAPGLFAVAKNSFQRYGDTWRQLVNVKTSKREYEECSYISGLGVIPLKQEGIPIDYFARLQGYKKRWLHDTYAGGVRISQEAIEDDQYDVMMGATKDLGISAAETQHINVASIFNTGFGTTVHTAGDALAIFSASHLRLDGVTFSTLQTAANLSYSVLQSMILNFENQKDHRGLKINQTPATLLVGTASEMKALQLLESIGQPETANNDINAVKRARPRLKLVVWPYITITNATFLIGDNAKKETGLIHFRRIPTTFGRDGDFETGDAKFKVRWRASTEVNCPIGLYGNYGL
jgi:phage major head subunit gpT-like protein